MVPFTGTGNDPEDGELSGASLQWTIRDNGGTVVATGIGKNPVFKLYATGCGTTYSVELKVTDSQDGIDTDTINTFVVSLLC